MYDPLNKQKKDPTRQDWGNTIFLLGTPLKDFGVSADEAAPTALRKIYVWKRERFTRQDC